MLAPRSGLWTPEDYRESLAQTAAALDNEFGRQWRPLEDTAMAAQLLYDAGSDYADYRRGVDFYPEGTLIWLDADVTIRQLSKGKKSLDDFCRAFDGGPGGAPALKPYDFDDVVAALNAVAALRLGRLPERAAALHQRRTRRSAASSTPAGSWSTTATVRTSGRPMRMPRS